MFGERPQHSYCELDHPNWGVGKDGLSKKLGQERSVEHKPNEEARDHRRHSSQECHLEPDLVVARQVRRGFIKIESQVIHTVLLPVCRIITLYLLNDGVVTSLFPSGYPYLLNAPLSPFAQDKAE